MRLLIWNVLSGSERRRRTTDTWVQHSQEGVITVISTLVALSWIYFPCTLTPGTIGSESRPASSVPRCSGACTHNSMGFEKFSYLEITAISAYLSLRAGLHIRMQ